jgi:hypothetical protein
MAWQVNTNVSRIIQGNEDEYIDRVTEDDIMWVETLMSKSLLDVQ